MHVDIADLEFLDKTAATLTNAVLAVDPSSSKVYIYPIRSRKQFLKNMNELYVPIDTNQKKASNMLLRTGIKFSRKKIKDLNGKYNVTLFTTSVRGGNHLLPNKKLENLKKGYLNSWKYLTNQKLK